MEHPLRGTCNMNESVDPHESTLCPWVPSLPFFLEKSPGFKAPSLQGSRDASETYTHYSGVDSNSGSPPKYTSSANAAVQCPPFGDCPHPSRSSRGATKYRNNSPEPRSIEPIQTLPFQHRGSSRDPERRKTPEEQSDDDGTNTSLKANESQLRPFNLVAEHNPNDPTHILKFLKRHVGGARCLWPHDEGECGFSSQVDLVKRHIKRVHYRLR